MNELAIASLAGYLLGSVPFGLVLTRMAGLGDIRSIGSGNIGATNVLRTGNKGLALATLILDSSKGAIAALLALHFLGTMAGLLAGVLAVLGHNFPIWLGFKGGKGVATSFGTLLVLSWQAGLCAAATWLLVAFIFRYSSLAALVALALAPFYAWYFSGNEVGMAVGFLGLLGIAMHHANISRLIAGTEGKIGKKN